MSALRDALASFVALRPRVVREREVLRVAARLSSHEVIADARREVLVWAQRRAGARLPEDAWNGRDFEELGGGRTCIATCFETPQALIWGLRTDDPDKDVPGRNWTTEVVIGGEFSATPWFGLRLLVNSPENEIDFAPHTPGFVQQVTEKVGLYRSERLIGLKTIVSSEEEADGLCDLLERSSRKLPVFVLSVPEGLTDGSPLIDPDTLGQAVLGLAHVFVLAPELSWSLTRRFGKRLSVFGGAVRCYEPGFDNVADPFRHKLFIADRLTTEGQISECQTWLRRVAATTSLRQIRLGEDLVSFANLRRARLSLERERIVGQGASSSDQLQVANKQIDELQSRLKDQEETIEYFEDEHRKAEETAANATARLNGASGRIEALEAKLNALHGKTGTEVELPASWDDFLDWCDDTLATKLRLETGARRAVRRPDFQDVTLAARCLLWLAGSARDSLLGRSDLPLRDTPVEEGIRNAPCGGDSYHISGGLQPLKVDWHVKNGGNTRDPRRCLRIYWAWDQANSEIVVADMPAHRVTGAT